MKQALVQTFVAVAGGALIGWTTADFWGVPAILSGAGFAIAGFFFVYQLRTGVGVLRPTWAKWRKRGPFFAFILFLVPAEIPAFNLRFRRLWSKRSLSVFARRYSSPKTTAPNN